MHHFASVHITKFAIVNHRHARSCCVCSMRPVPAQPVVYLPSSLRWRSLSSSRGCRRELSEEGEKADNGGGARSGPS
jgi:hypothetical protein